MDRWNWEGRGRSCIARGFFEGSCMGEGRASKRDSLSNRGRVDRGVNPTTTGEGV